MSTSASIETVTVADLVEAAGVPEGVLLAWVRSGKLSPLPEPRRTRAYRFAPETLEQARRLGEARRLLKGA